MVEELLIFNRTGLRDWLLQRVSALIIALYSTCLLGFWLTHPRLAFIEWKTFLTRPVMSVFAMLMLAALLVHAWIGVWTVLTDYVKCHLLRLALEIVVVLVLMGYFAWGIEILWRI